MADPMKALQKASAIGSADPDPSNLRRRTMPMPTPADEANPMRKIMQLLSGLADPLGLGPDAKEAPASIGGLPEGLNPLAIKILLKQNGINLADEGESGIRTLGMMSPEFTAKGDETAINALRPKTVHPDVRRTFKR